MTAGPSNAPSPPSGRAESAERLLDALEHFRSIATMLELIDRLPDLAEDVRDWRPLDPNELFADPAAPTLDAVAHHALEAVVNGLDMLGIAAATLCDNAEGRLAADEIVACRDIGGAMMSLFERAKALLQPDAAPDSAAERAQLYRSFLQAPFGPASPPGRPLASAEAGAQSEHGRPH